MTKNDILLKAINIISTEGYDKLTLSSLAEMLGVKKASIYYHFNSKEDIISALYENAKKLLTKFTFYIDFSLSAEEVLNAVYEHWDMIYQDREFAPYLSLLEQRYMVDDEALNISSSLDLMIDAQSDAVIDNLIERKKLFFNDKKLLSRLFSATAKDCLKRGESESFINSFVSSFSH